MKYMRNRKRHGRAIVTLATLVVAGAVAVPKAEEDGLPKTRLSVGFCSSSFANVHRNDAENAFKVFTRTVGRARGFDMQVETHVYDDPKLFESAIRNQELNLVSVDAWQFLAMNVRDCIEPLFAAQKQGAVLEEYLLLARRDSGIESLSDLAEKEITVLHAGNTRMAKPWLDTLVLSGGLGTSDSFFQTVKVTGKTSSAILPVFFRKKDACVIDRGGFEVMGALNPQIQMQLHPIAISPPYLDVLICVSHTGLAPGQRKALIQGLADLHVEPKGQQILTLFKIDRMVPFHESYLESARTLRKQYDRLTENYKDPLSESQLVESS